MKQWMRKETRTQYEIVTIVCENGSYIQFCLWDDGVMTGIVITSIQEMGWESVERFLRHRKEFKEVRE